MLNFYFNLMELHPWWTESEFNTNLTNDVVKHDEITKCFKAEFPPFNLKLFGNRVY